MLPETKAKVVKVTLLAGLFALLAVLVVSLISTGVRHFTFSKESGEATESTSRPAGDSIKLPELTQLAAFRQAFIEANGGAQKLADLRSIQTSGTFESGGNSGVPFRTIKRRPDKSITTLKMEGYDLSFVVNSGVVWQRVEQPGMEPVDTLKTGDEADAIREMGHFFDPLMHVVLNEPESIVGIEETTWEGEPALSIEFNSESRGMRATTIIDPRDMTPVRRVERFADDTTRKVHYADYHQISGGLLEPFSIETYLDDTLQSRVTVEDCEINVGAASFLFEYTGEGGN